MYAQTPNCIMFNHTVTGVCLDKVSVISPFALMFLCHTPLKNIAQKTAHKVYLEVEHCLKCFSKMKPQYVGFLQSA